MTEQTALVAAQPAGPMLPSESSWRTMYEMAKAFHASKILPNSIKSPEAALVVMQLGLELGVRQMTALTNINVIQGKPTAGANLMRMLIYRDHGDNALIPVERTADRCTIRYQRRGWKEAQEYTLTMEQASKIEVDTWEGPEGSRRRIRKPLTDNPAWKSYPDAMLYARATSAVAMMAFPDSIGGLYTPDELGAEVTVDDAGEVRVTDVTSSQEPKGLAETSSGTVNTETGEVVKPAADRGPNVRDLTEPRTPRAPAKPTNGTEEKTARQEMNRLVGEVAKGRGETWNAMFAEACERTGLKAKKALDLTSLEDIGKVLTWAKRELGEGPTEAAEQEQPVEEIADAEYEELSI